MSAAPKVDTLHPSPEQLIRSALDETGDFDQAVAKCVKELRGRRAALLPAFVGELAMLIVGGKPAAAKPIRQSEPTDSEKEARRLERMARRLRLAAEVDAAAEKRVLMKMEMPNGLTLAKCTLDYIARLCASETKRWQRFSRFGKLRDKRTMEDAWTEGDLAKAKIDAP